MKHSYIALTLVLATSLAQAGVYKCKTDDGFTYSEHPCPPGTTSASIRTLPAPKSQSTPPSAGPNANTAPAANAGENAAPTTLPDSQRGAYEAYMSKPNPKAFVLCSDGRALSYSGEPAYLDQKLASLPSGCAVYSRDGNLIANQ